MAKGKRGMSKKALLAAINQAMETLESGIQFKSFPDHIPGCEVLADKKVVVVDDTVEMLLFIVAPLMVETNGKARFIPHKEQSLDELVRVISKEDPDVVLVDENLAGKVKGHELVASIKKKNPRVLCIGFPIGPNLYRKEFKAAGAEGSVLKDSQNPKETLIQIAQIVSSAQV